MISKNQSREKKSESEELIYIGSINPKLKLDIIEKYFVNLGLKISIQRNRKKKSKHFLIGKTKDPNTFNYLTVIKIKHKIGGLGFTTEAFLTGEEKLAKDIEESKRKIFVENLPIEVTDDELKLFFEKFGPIKAAYTKKRVKKYEFDDGEIIGFVIFFDEKDVSELLRKSMNLYFKGNEISISSFRPKWEKVNSDGGKKQLTKDERKSLIQLIIRKGRIPLQSRDNEIENLFNNNVKEMEKIKNFTFNSEFGLEKELLGFIDLRHKLFINNLKFKKELDF